MAPAPFGWAQFAFVPTYPNELVLRPSRGSQIFRTHCAAVSSVDGRRVAQLSAQVGKGAGAGADAIVGAIGAGGYVVDCVAHHAHAVITQMGVSPDGDLLVTGDDAGALMAWSLHGQHSGMQQQQQHQQGRVPAVDALAVFSRAHVGAVTALCVMVDAFASGGSDQTVRLWEVSTRQCLHAFAVEASCVSALTAFRTAGFAPRIPAFDASAAQHAHAAQAVAEERLRHASLVEAAESEVLAVASVDGSVFFFALDSLRLLHVLLLPDGDAGDEDEAQNAGGSDVTVMSASADGGTFVVGTLGGALHVHALRGTGPSYDSHDADADEGEGADASEPRITHSTMSPSDLATADAPIRVLSIHRLDASPVVAAAFSAHGVKADHVLACAYSGRVLRVFEPPSAAAAADDAADDAANNAAFITFADGSTDDEERPRAAVPLPSAHSLPPRAPAATPDSTLVFATNAQRAGSMGTADTDPLGAESSQPRIAVPSPSRLRPPQPICIDDEDDSDDDRAENGNRDSASALPAAAASAVAPTESLRERLTRRRDAADAQIARGIGGVAAERERTMFAPRKIDAVLSEALARTSNPDTAAAACVSDAALARPSALSSRLFEARIAQLEAASFDAAVARTPALAASIDRVAAAALRASVANGAVKSALDADRGAAVYDYAAMAAVEPAVLPVVKAAPKHLDAKWVASLRVKPSVRAIFSADMFAQFADVQMCGGSDDDDDDSSDSVRRRRLAVQTQGCPIPVVSF